MNINQGAKGNPLDTLLNGRNIFGSTGFSIENAIAQSNSGNTGVRGQLGQFGTFGTSYDDSNTFNPTGQDITQQGRISIDGKQYAQLANTGIGGPGQAIDPSKVTWNDKYGLITDPTNIKAAQDDWAANYAPFVIVGGALAAAGAAGAFAGGAGEAGAGAGSSAGLGAGAVAPGMGAQAAMESSLLNAGIVPGSAEWTSALAQAGLDTTAGAGAGVGGGGVGGDGIPDTQQLYGSGDLTPAESGNGASTFDTVRSTASNLNRVRQLAGLLNGSGAKGRTGGGMGDNSGGGLLGGLMSLLGLGALGRQGGLIGNGVGTPGGAQAVGDRASAMADPWGTSGLRGQAQQALTPGVMMSGLGLDPNGMRSDITKDPGYQFALEQGTNAINVGDAAQGTLRSGNRGAELAKYGTGLAAQYEGQFRNENMASLGALSNMAGLSSSSPTAAAQSQIGAFAGATSLQNAGLNGLLGTLLNGGGPGGAGGLGGLFSALGGGLTSILGKGGDAVSGFFNNLFGGGDGGGGDTSGVMNDILGGLGGDSGSVDDIAGWAL